MEAFLQAEDLAQSNLDCNFSFSYLLLGTSSNMPQPLFSVRPQLMPSCSVFHSHAPLPFPVTEGGVVSPSSERYVACSHLTDIRETSAPSNQPLWAAPGTINQPFLAKEILCSQAHNSNIISASDVHDSFLLLRLSVSTSFKTSTFLPTALD